MFGSKTNIDILCGLCKATIGKGRGQRTGIQITNFRVVLTPNDPALINLRGMPIKATINMCLPCCENITENLIRKDVLGKTELDSRDVKPLPISLVVNPKKKPN